MYARPIVEVVPLQLLAYHMAVLKGTDVDQPRNLAKASRPNKAEETQCARHNSMKTPHRHGDQKIHFVALGWEFFPKI